MAFNSVTYLSSSSKKVPSPNLTLQNAPLPRVSFIFMKSLRISTSPSYFSSIKLVLSMVLSSSYFISS